MVEDSNEIVIKREQAGSSQIEKRIPGLLEVIALDDILVELRKMNKQFAKSEFQGLMDPRTLDVKHSEQSMDLINYFPFTPWISAAAVNRGPNMAYLAINEDEHWIPLPSGEGHNFDFSLSENRIRIIYYKSDPGGRASVQINGKY